MPLSLLHCLHRTPHLGSDVESIFTCAKAAEHVVAGCIARVDRGAFLPIRKLISIGSTRRASCPSATSCQCINASAESYHLTECHRPTGSRRCSITSLRQLVGR